MPARLAALALVALALAAARAAAQPARPSIQDNDWNVRIALYGAGLVKDRPSVHLVPGQALARIYVRCDRDNTTAPPRTTCAAIDRKALRGEPMTGSFWTWAEHTFRIADRAATAAEVRAVRELLTSEHPAGAGPATIVIVELTDWSLHDEYVGRGCEGVRHQPCDPIAVPTGRKLRVPSSTTPAYLGPYGLPTDWTYTDELLAMLGSGQTLLPSPTLLVPFGTPHQDHVLDAYNNRYHAAAVLPYLEQARDPDPDIQLALAWDRLVIAAYARDPGAFQRAYAAFGKARAARPHPPEVFTRSFARTLPLLDLVASGKARLTPPFGVPPLAD